MGQKAIAISGTVAITAYGRQACVTMLWEMQLQFEKLQQVFAVVN